MTHDLHVIWWWQVSRSNKREKGLFNSHQCATFPPCVHTSGSFKICVLVGTLGVIIQNVRLYQTMQDYRGLTNFAGPHLIYDIYVLSLHIASRFPAISLSVRWNAMVSMLYFASLASCPPTIQMLGRTGATCWRLHPKHPKVESEMHVCRRSLNYFLFESGSGFSKKLWDSSSFSNVFNMF